MKLESTLPDSGRLAGSSALGAILPAAATAADSGTPPGLPRLRLSSSQALGNDQQLNAQITSAQQALGFLDRTASQLQALKQELGARLAGRPGDQAALARHLADFAANWSQRVSDTGASLDASLKLVAPGEAQRSFRLRGISLQSLQQGGTETLSFYPGGPGKPSQSVVIDPGLTADEIVGRFNKGLAAAGISASLGSDGELTFSVAETAWPALADNLQLKGDGIRFPSGQPNRVRLDPQGDSITPASWSGDDVAGLRRSLQQVVAAIQQVQASRERVEAALARANSLIAAASSVGEPAWAKAFAGDFSSSLQQGSGYALLNNIAPVLIGISRYRVVSLLSL
ncbi:hypothetical protein [Vogesella sp. LIG4]|uniref:hypothetical protein n=1 Tax=Vogesella sp. LIG4 TaxID=1192162 RepID=UPI00081F7D0F|nr:hypothetical protein [Vogesella sp. LIG4]SCK17669.1 hypothetical protein PSELUDRAFT_1879 [Vogesella sp. LIG4]